METHTGEANPALEASQEWEERVLIVRQHFRSKGYRVHSGLQFGCELVLYADDPSKVHSDFCVHVLPKDGKFDWRIIQTMVRSMPDLHKTLIIANIRQTGNGEYQVDEIAMTSEHAPFRHRQQPVGVGDQRKKARIASEKAESL